MAQSVLIAATLSAATSADFTVAYTTPATISVYSSDPTGDIAQDFQCFIEQKAPAGASPAYIPLQLTEREVRAQCGMYQRQVMVVPTGTYRVNKPATVQLIGVALDQ
jgi:hypothetical protein